MDGSLKMEKKRVLIGLVWNEKSAYALNELLASLKRIKDFSVHEIDVALADDSIDKSYLKRFESCLGEIIQKDLMPNMSREEYLQKYPTIQEKMVNARNIIRKHAIDGGYDYVFWLDGDVICPPNAIDTLISCNVNVVSGIRPQHGQIPGIFPFNPKYPLDLYETHSLPNFMIVDWEWLCPTRLVEVSCFGFGCCLMSRKALESCEFWTKPKSPATEDILYCFDLRMNGFRIYAHTGMLCAHLYRFGPNTSGRDASGKDERFDFGGDWSNIDQYRKHTIQWRNRLKVK